MNVPTMDAKAAGARTMMRSGTAARLAGLSASTLRIWEHRYAVVAPPRSPTGQRTYSMHDVERLRLIKRLTVEGHAIGTVAHLDIESLAALSSRNVALAKGVPRVVVAGRALARKLEGALRPAPAHVFDDVLQAERDLAQAGACDVLVMHVPSLHESMTERLRALGKNLPARQLVVVYAFGPEAVAESLRAAGVTVRREPVSARELTRLIVSSLPDAEPVCIAAPSIHRRYSDAELATLTEMPSSVACECPRHLAEIVTLLASFERYSSECASKDQQDAALHRHLQEVTTTARSMLEGALERVIVEEGLVL